METADWGENAIVAVKSAKVSSGTRAQGHNWEGVAGLL
jgi:hypothetical protein